MKGCCLPIAFTSTFFLHFLGVGIDMTVLAEVARKMLDIFGSTVGETGVVTIILLVGAGHWHCKQLKT